MSDRYDGLPAAANVEQSIVLAQLLILKDLERQAQARRAVPKPDESGAQRQAA